MRAAVRAVVTTLSVLAALLATMPGTSAIQNGAPDGSSHSFTGVVGTTRSGRTSSFIARCGATMVGPDTVIAPARIMRLVEDAFSSGAIKLWVFFGPSGYPASLSGAIRVSQLHIHPDYRLPTEPGSKTGLDLAVLTLNIAAASPGAFIPEPALLPSEGFLDDLLAEGALRGGTLTAVGFSPVVEFVQDRPVVLEPVRRRVASVPFQSLHPDLILLNQVPARGDGAVCLAFDLGGPLLLDVEGTERLLGMTVGFGEHCGPPGSGVRLDTPDAREFLGQFVSLP